MNSQNASGEADIRKVLSKINLDKPVFEGNRFQTERFRAKVVEACFFFKTDFTQSALIQSRFTTCKFQKASFQGTDLSGASFSYCMFKEINFADARLHRARFVHCSFEQCVFVRANVDQILLEHCFFANINLDQVVNINECRVLMGLFLKQHAGHSTEKHSIATALTADLALEKSLKALPVVIKKWIEQVCHTYPEAGLEAGFRKMGLFIEKRPSPGELDTFIFDSIAPRDFVILQAREASYYAISEGQNLLTPKNIRAKLIDFYKEYKYPSDQTEMVSVLGEKCAPPALEELVSLHWPFPPQNTIATSGWNQKAQVALTQMIEDEQVVSAMICAYLKDHLKEVQSVIDVACSHGFVLQQLHALKPSLYLMGRDIASEMLAKASERVPWADLQVGNALDLGAIKADVVILRATGQAVTTPAEAEKMIQEGLSILNPQGKLIVCSLTPPVFNPAHLQQWGKVLVSTKMHAKGISAFYVLTQK